jgi:hypothetical protein
MGIDPDAPQSVVETLPRLPKGLDRVRLENVLVADNPIAVEHPGNSEARFTNQAGPPLAWKVAFSIPPLQAPAFSSMDWQLLSSPFTTASTATP